MNGSSSNGCIPPSTRAAQLAEHLVGGRAVIRGQDDGSFQQLLHEVLSADPHPQPGVAEVSESEIEVNSRLLFVIIKAGIETTAHPNPFLYHDSSRRQIVDSLRAVDITVQRTPTVVFSTTFNQWTGGDESTLMFQWLVPKVLALLATLKEADVQEQIVSVLTSCLLAGRKSRGGVMHAEKTWAYLKFLIRGLMLCIEQYADLDQLSCKIPSHETSTDVDSFTGQAGPESEIPQLSVKSHAQAISTILIILDAVTQVELRQTLRRPVARINIPAATGWSIGVVLQVCHTICLKLDLPKLQRQSSDCLTRLIKCTCDLIIDTSKKESSFSDANRLLFGLAQLMISILESCSLEEASSLELILSTSLLKLFSVAQPSTSIAHCLKEAFLPALEQIYRDELRMQMFSLDLKNILSFSISLMKNFLMPRCEGIEPPCIPAFHNSHLADLSAKAMLDLGVKSPSERDVRPSKRIRLSNNESTSSGELQSALVIEQICQLLGVKCREVQELKRISLERYNTLSDKMQCEYFTKLGLLACTVSKHLVAEPRGPLSYERSATCDSCGSALCEGVDIAQPEKSMFDEIVNTLNATIDLPKHQKTRQPRVAAMMAIKRVLAHSVDEDSLDLVSSKIGQWCLQALQSSVRELRIAAGRTLPLFMTSSVPQTLVSKNRLLVLDFLKGLSEHKDIALQETSVLAWAQLVRKLEDGDELNLVLLKLVEYLGHTNSLIAGLAFDELQRICNHSPYSAMKLFAPYWPSVAVAAIQDLNRRPQIAQQVSDLVGMSVTDFLVLTQIHTIPFFVLTKRQDLLQRIAEACNLHIVDLCKEHSNLVAILSNILLRSSSEAESLVIALLNAVSPEFRNVDCAELLKSEPQATAAELLKFAGKDDEKERSKAHQALHFLANITHGRPSSSRTSRRMDIIGSFFENHVLGIMALLADTINDGKGPQPTIEKVRCLGAVREMIKVAKSSVCNGLPQICACLRSAIRNPELSNPGFETWVVMIDLLSDEDIAPLLDPTFALIVQFWDHFAPSTQAQAHDMISRLLKLRTTLIRDMVHTLPSLASISLMSKFEEELGKLKSQMDVKHRLLAFGRRCQNENATVVTRALTELNEYLQVHKDWIYETASSEQPDPVVGELTRSILDTSVLFSDSSSEIAILCAKSLGLIGCLDYTKIEAIREKQDILILSNFSRTEEVQDFVIFLLREVLVKSFLCAMNSRSQGFLAYAMQELLAIGEFPVSVGTRSRDAPYDANQRRWASLPESMRTLLTPFLNSKYFVTAGLPQQPCTYPIFDGRIGHRQWIRTLTFDLLKTDAGNQNVQILFSVLSRIVRSQDTAISEILLPYAMMNILISGTDQHKLNIANELRAVLTFSANDQSAIQDNLILCSQTIFRVLDYLSRWMQEMKKELAGLQSGGSRASRIAVEADLEKHTLQISSVETLLNLVPADVISRRAVDCKSYARALFHWEQYIRQERQDFLETNRKLDTGPLYERLQDIYTQIDEPDGIEGISAHLHILNIDQQILEHRKAGRWTAAQSWYEMRLVENPNNQDLQYNLLMSLKESGQYETILKQVRSPGFSKANKSMLLPFAAEAAWMTAKWEQLRAFVAELGASSEEHFNIEIGRLLLAFSEGNSETIAVMLDKLRYTISRSISHTSASSMQICHDAMLKLHALADMEAVQISAMTQSSDKAATMTSLDRRLDMFGPFLHDKQGLLGLRRAAMQCFSDHFTNNDVASAWLATARFARKGNSLHEAFDAVLHASQLGYESATIEHSRLLWREGNHRKAIQSLEGAIAANAFKSHDYTETNDSATTANNPQGTSQRNILKAKAHLLLAKWIDRAGQTQSEAIISEYKKAVDCHNRWEKGHYYLGKHYNKLLESEKAKPPSKQAQTFINGETAKLVVENYLRSLAFGVKYIHQTLPRILTLWLELGSDVEQPLDPKYGNDESFRNHIMSQRRKLLAACNSQIKKYTDRLGAFVFYTALSQIVARICHPHQAVNNLLLDIIAKVVCQNPPQALWALLAVVKSSSRERAQRGAACLTRVLENARKARGDTSGNELKVFVLQSQRLSDQLLHVCEGEIHGKASNVSLSKDLGFNHKTAVCKLAVPLESSMTASLPTAMESSNLRMHKAFNTHDYVSISSFLDDVLVLNSLQRPRRISIRGSNGRIYALLCKPKDDLRKDQRLMEFNKTINRALKKDAESSKRRLYIKTYAVTPLNEECGLIEWVDNLKTLREILLHNYKQKHIAVNYTEIRTLLNESISTPSKLSIFTDQIIPHFPPVFHEWFVEKFPEPGAWFTARLRYVRSCAVMSIVGHVLGLGDRHGENILFEEGNGGTLHVDFNCLFDKGLTFEKPELVPFRLTHNMVDAFGAQSCEGPFRKSCELSLSILRGYEDTLMTILETFLYDPTTDFIGKKKRTNHVVPDTPEGVLESVRNKVRGLFTGESVPLSIEGYVEELITRARSPHRLASMYIGWCAFF